MAIKALKEFKNAAEIRKAMKLAVSSTKTLVETGMKGYDSNTFNTKEGFPNLLATYNWTATRDYNLVLIFLALCNYAATKSDDVKNYLTTYVRKKEQNVFLDMVKPQVSGDKIKYVVNTTKIESDLKKDDGVLKKALVAIYDGCSYNPKAKTGVEDNREEAKIRYGKIITWLLNEIPKRMKRITNWITNGPDVVRAYRYVCSNWGVPVDRGIPGLSGMLEETPASDAKRDTSEHQDNAGEHQDNAGEHQDNTEVIREEPAPTPMGPDGTGNPEEPPADSSDPSDSLPVAPPPPETAPPPVPGQPYTTGNPPPAGKPENPLPTGDPSAPPSQPQDASRSPEPPKKPQRKPKSTLTVEGRNIEVFGTSLKDRLVKEAGISKEILGEICEKHKDLVEITISTLSAEEFEKADAKILPNTSLDKKNSLVGATFADDGKNLTIYISKNSSVMAPVIRKKQGSSLMTRLQKSDEELQEEIRKAEEQEKKAEEERRREEEEQRKAAKERAAKEKAKKEEEAQRQKARDARYKKVIEIIASLRTTYAVALRPISTASVKKGTVLVGPSAPSTIRSKLLKPISDLIAAVGRNKGLLENRADDQRTLNSILGGIDLSNAQKIEGAMYDLMFEPQDLKAHKADIDKLFESISGEYQKPDGKNFERLAAYLDILGKLAQ